jgi:F-type H+-transporting ATPase subunit delta
VAEKHRETGLAGRYATALLELAQEEKAVEAVESDLETLRRLISESKDLLQVLRSPIFSRAEHARAMKAVLEALGANALTTKFVLTLAKKRRLFALPEIIRSFQDKLASQRGEVNAQVTSAYALSESQLETLRSVLKSSLGRDPRIETRVDPSLLGGLIVMVGSRMIDSSLRTKLHGIRTAMRGG